MSSGAILRRNSSKQGLQNLLKITAQRSIEDAEEVERERRRRARESFRKERSTTLPGALSQENGGTTEDSLYNHSEMKPSGSPSLEEDEGFSDWTQRRERRRQQRMEELSQGQDANDKKEEKKEAVNGEASMAEKTSSVRITSTSHVRRRNTEEEEREKMLTGQETDRRRTAGKEELAKEEWAQKEKERKETERDKQKEREREREAQKLQSEQMKVFKKEEEDRLVGTKGKGKEVKVSYTSSSQVFLTNQNNTNGNTPREEETSRPLKTKRTPSRPAAVQSVDAGEAEETAAILETEQRLEKIRRSHQEKESQELEQLRMRQLEAEQELEELKRRREKRRGVREEEERRREEEELQRLAKEEEEKKRMKEDIERRRTEAAERMRNLSSSAVDGEEMFSPLSPKGPTFKITERTESLNRSLKKSTSFKKTQPPLLMTKIDDKLEQYTHAIETSQEAKTGKQGVTDLLSPPEAVASKKNLFEAGDAWLQSPSKGTPCKDAEGLKVGVADLITQWVKGPDGSIKQSPNKTSDVRPGDVMQKKNMWEIIGDTSSGRPGQGNTGTPSGKRYKFVVTGHGKYAKFPTAGADGEEYTNGKSDLCSGDY